MNDFFSDLRESIGTLMDDDQKADLKRMGEKFYGSIDMDKYQPRLASEAKDEPLIDAEIVERMRYIQLKKAIESGLQPEDLSDDERELMEKFHMNDVE